jgi:predicted LPLAT superfamily acyltransferase
MNGARHWASVAERGALWGMKLVAFAYRVLGRRISGAILVPVVAYFYLTDPSARRCSLAFLRRAHDAKELAAPTSWTSFRHFLTFAMKSLDAFAAWSGKPGPVAVEGGEAVEQALAEGKGAMLLVSHLGNADVSRACLAERIGKPVTMLLHTRHARLYNEMLRFARGGAEVHAVEVTEIGPEVAIDLSERVARGEWIAMAADRTPVLSPARTARVPFLGAAAAFSLGPYILAALMACPVYVMFCLREGDRHRVYFELLADRIELPRRNKDATLAEWAARYASCLERYALRAPLQWYNFYDFWADEPRPGGSGPMAPAPVVERGQTHTV